jgi:hypothetical protein
MADNKAVPNEPISWPRYPGWCSFCRKNYKEVGGLAEGPDQVYICFKCCLLCATIIHEGYQRGVIQPSLPREK